jgi:prepilin-type N-terminal cleavage/methylation domain-containing protein
MTHKRQRESGFTVVEMMIVMAVGVTLVGFALMSSGGALTTFKARGVVSKVQAQFVRARETAISEQRDVQVVFVGTNEIDLVRMEKPSGTTTISKTMFEGGLIFTKVTGVPETPDVWGGNTAIAFSPATTIQFRAGTGVLMDGTTLLPVSGRVFVGIAGKPETAGMVSVFGATGRVRAYHWEGQWVF